LSLSWNITVSFLSIVFYRETLGQ